jgi:hypothetical protein
MRGLALALLAAVLTSLCHEAMGMWTCSKGVKEHDWIAFDDYPSAEDQQYLAIVAHNIQVFFTTQTRQCVSFPSSLTLIGILIDLCLPSNPFQIHLSFPFSLSLCALFDANASFFLLSCNFIHFLFCFWGVANFMSTDQN